MKVCHNCGATLYDVQKICPECNTPTPKTETYFRPPTDTQSDFNATNSYRTIPQSYSYEYTYNPSPAKKSKSGVILLVIGLIVAVAVFVVAFLLLSPNGARSKEAYTEPIYIIEDAYNAGDPHMIFEAFPDLPDEYDTLLSVFADAYEDEFEELKDYKTTVEILDKEPLSKLELSTYASNFGLDSSSVTEGYSVNIVLTAKKGLNETSLNYTAVVCNVKGTWKLFDFIER